MAPFSLDQAIAWFLTDRQARNLSDGTLHYYRVKLAHLSAHLGARDPASITIHDIRQCLADLRTGGMSVSTINHCIIAIKALFRWLYAEEVIPTDAVSRLSKLKQEARIPDAVSLETFQQLLAALPKTFSGLRDRVMLLTVLDTGLRLSELMGLTIETVDLQYLVVRVMGKGRRERIVPFSAALAVELAKYGMQRAARATETNRWWIRATGQPLSSYHPDHMLYRLCDKLGLPRIHIHQLRHSAATELLRGGASVTTVQRILGHQSVTTTMRYTHLLDRDVIAAHRTASPVEAFKKAK